MLLSSCPRCHDSIRLPATAQANSIVRCPRCREEFPMHEILDQLPPEAEIVSGPGAVGHTVMPTNLSDATEYVLAGEEGKESPPDFRFKETGSLKSDIPPMAKIDSSRPPRRPKRPEPNIALEFVKVVVGGIAGLALAVLAIMWFMHQDPFGIAEKLPVQAYMILPEELRTKEMKRYAKGEDAAPEPKEDIELTVEKISIEKFPVADEPTTEPPVDASPFDEPPSVEPPMPAPSDTTPSMTQPPLEEPPMEKPAVKESPQEASPAPASQTSDRNATPVVTLEEEVSMANEASELLGEIGAQIPEPPVSEPAPPTNVGNVDLSPVDDGEN